MASGKYQADVTWSSEVLHEEAGADAGLRASASLECESDEATRHGTA